MSNATVTYDRTFQFELILNFKFSDIQNKPIICFR